jgi:hypothetical protein
VVNRILDRLQLQPARVLAAHENRERIVEPQRCGKRDTGSRITLPDALEHRPRRRTLNPRNLFFEDRRQRRPRVFDVVVDFARSYCAIADERPSQVEPALDVHISPPFDGARDDLAEHELLGEVLRTDPDDLAT